MKNPDLLEALLYNWPTIEAEIKDLLEERRTLLEEFEHTTKLFGEEMDRVHTLQLERRTLLDVLRTAEDTLLSIADHSKEFSDIEDFEFMLVRIEAKAKQGLSTLYSVLRTADET